MKTRLISAFFISLILVCLFSGPARSGGIEIIDHKTEREGLFSNTVTAVSPDDESGVFIASGGGLHILIDYFFLPIFQNIPGRALSRDPGGDLWAAADGSLIYRIAERDGIWSATRIPFKHGKKITSIAARHGAVTVGTDSGLYYYGDSDGQFHTIIKDGAYTALAASADGTIIAGCRRATPKKGGLLIIGGRFGSRTGWVDELSGKAVTALFVDNDRLLIGTQADGVFVLDDAGVHNLSLPENPGRITALLADGGITLVAADRGLYGAKGNGTFEVLSAPDGGTPANVTCLAPGPGGAVWVGTGKDGIYLVRVRP
jgi:ligand-binding sensor domain-containing protein